ncbi:MAG TPA: phosphatase PAP2 family protein [Geobacteraceae bacterium]|nr:phosphatase PAP2 family protein [Geobacteraceae bacterium]
MPRLFIGLVLTALLVFVCHCYVDVDLALLIKRKFAGSPAWDRYIVAIPSHLLLLVSIMTGGAVVGYLALSRKGIDIPARSFLHLVAYVIPAAFVAKTVLKLIFGGINTRAWLNHPQLYGFHWFDGGGVYDGFPSGHMAVFTALTASLWRFFPRYRFFCPFFLLVLGSALIVTNYHFLGDVLAGAYLGVFVEAISFRLLSRHRHIPGH